VFTKQNFYKQKTKQKPKTTVVKSFSGMNRF